MLWKIAFVMALFWSSASQAANWSSWDESVPDELEFIFVRDNGVVFELQKTTRPNVQGDCTRKFIIPLASINYEQKSRALTAAFFSRIPYTVRISYDKDSKDCYSPVQWIGVEPRK